MTFFLPAKLSTHLEAGMPSGDLGTAEPSHHSSHSDLRDFCSREGHLSRKVAPFGEDLVK